MSSWSTFRRIRLGVFVLITLVSLLLTVVYALFLSKDFYRYNVFQRGIVTALTVINGITAILMYLMLAVRYSTTWDAVRIIILLGCQGGSTALFTLHSANLPCDAFKAEATCRQISFYTAIVSWALCGLLVIYGACLAIMSCIPQPPPIDIMDPELDAGVPVNAQARRVSHLFIQSQPKPINFNAEKQPYSTGPLPGARNATGFVDSTQSRQQSQQQREVREGYGAQYRPNVSPAGLFGRDGSAPYRRMPSVEEIVLSPTAGAYADTIPRGWTQTPNSIPSLNRPASLLAGSARSATLPPPPLPAQFSAVQRPTSRMRSSSLSASIYSVASRDSMDLPPPPLPSFGVRRVDPDEQSIRSASSDVGSGQWKQLVLEAAAGRRQGPF